MTDGFGGWVRPGAFISVTFPEPGSPSVQVPVSDRCQFLTLAYTPGQPPTMTLGGEPVALERVVGADGETVWRPKA